MIKDKVVENIALFDMDGTLCDYDKAMECDYNAIKSPNDPEYKSFSKEIENASYLKNRVRLIRNQPGWWQNLDKLKAGFNILELARELGFDIGILTKGPRSATNSWQEKVDWIKKNIPDADNVEITISENKSQVYGKVLVDDYPEYAKSWLGNRPRGLVIMPEYAWNKDFKHENVIHYDGTNLEQIKKALIKAKNRGPSEKVNYKE